MLLNILNLLMALSNNTMDYDGITNRKSKAQLYSGSEDSEDELEKGFVTKKRRITHAENDSDSSVSDDASSLKPDINTLKDGDVHASTSVVENDDMFASEDEQESSNQNAVVAEKTLYEPAEAKKGDIQIEAFNLDEESKTGTFDKFGNYTETKVSVEDAIQDQDQWYDDYKESEQLQKAKAAQIKMAKQQEELRTQVSKNKRLYTLEEALKRLRYFLSGNETVLNALGRLNVARAHYKKKSTRSKTSKRSEPGVDDPTSLENVCFEYTVHSINFLAELLEIVERKGITEVNDLTRARVESLIEEESLDDQPINDYETKLWSFKWIRDLSVVNGTFTNYEMQSWKDTYFEDNVVVKYVDDEDQTQNWVYIECLQFI
ncbi:LAME_0G02498g1_1 [Lachancea meyersii CBS 8951]|uniref:LAME_0G02498g1_1 n=1 Tax=Lachancea meyersii CBS 8951 TaxID=1266667 RepID=A0A1G4K5Z9_9SACH|nr:LAME_0G02498g1_1 [Lachancea meyersii CBS 8951]